MTNHLPGNPYHERAELLRLMHANLDEINEKNPISRTTTELLLFEISDRLAAIAYEQRTANEINIANGPHLMARTGARLTDIIIEDRMDDPFLSRMKEDQK